MSARHIALAITLLCSFFLTNTVAINQCGGDKQLSIAVGELCESQLRADCPYGRIACQGANSVACVPNCDITFEQIVRNSLSCKNKGIPVCKCPVGYSGRECETRDACANIECGSHGVCENGSCVCDAEYMGARCEIKRDCVGSNFVWTGSTCVCAANYEGPRCDRCVSGLLCVPLDKNGKRFGSVRISNESILLNMLSDPPPPEYTAKPRRPSPLTLCSCEMGDGTSASYFQDDDDGSEYFAPDDYVHRYYRDHFRHDDCYAYILWAGGAAFFVLLLIIVIGCLLMSPSPEPVLDEKLKKSSMRRNHSFVGAK